MTDRLDAARKDLPWLWDTLRRCSQPLTRNQNEAFAARLSEEAICESLGLPADGAIDRHLYVMAHFDGDHVERWSEGGQTFDWFDDTPEALRIAQTQYLRKRGYPVFYSLEEAEECAARQTWPAIR
jgi:hypothetical protein